MLAAISEATAEGGGNLAAWLPAVFGLVGVVLGALLASAFELWRRALDGQAAARVIRMETIENRTRLELVLSHNFHAENLKTSAWETYRLVIAPFLEELEFSRLAESYSHLDQIPRMMSVDMAMATKKLISWPTSRARESLERWLTRARDNGKTLRRIEATNPWLLATNLLRSRRVATEDEIRKEFGLEEHEPVVNEMNQR